VAQQQTAPTPVPRRSPAPQPPAPQPTPQPPAPPAPRVNRTELAQARPVLPPNPVAAPIRMPQPPAPRSIATGPIINTPGVGGGSRSAGGSDSGSPGPSQVPGAVSGGGGSFGGGAYGGPSGRGGRAGGAGGAGGSGSFNQYGSGSGSGGRSGVDALPDTDFGPYIAELQRRIKRNWNPPSDSRSKRIVAIFTIGKDGRLLSVRLRAPSGVKLADDAALAAVRASAPFRPLPATFRNDEVDVEFTFDYSVYSSGGVGGGHVRP
jgi:TonB family protein